MTFTLVYTYLTANAKLMLIRHYLKTETENKDISFQQPAENNTAILEWTRNI